MDTDLVKSREIAISDLNNSISIKSGFEGENLEMLASMALHILDCLRDDKE